MIYYQYVPVNKIKSWILVLWKAKDGLIIKKNLITYIVLLFVVILTIKIFTLNESNKLNISQCCNDDNQLIIQKDAADKKVNFNHFNNETGTPDGCYIVPNIVHFIRFKGEPISYLHMICYLAAFKNQKPDKIYFHFDNKTTFSGKYWNILKNTPGFMEVVEFNYVNMPDEIFGQKLSDGWREFHGSDITRIRVLMQYGGIFLDNDSYLIRSLNDFRRYEMTIGWDDGGQFLGTQVLVAHKDARFLSLWLETYRGAYRSDLWYYNAGERPTVEVLYKKPELVHRVKYLFGVHNSLVVNIFKIYWPEWRYMYALHLLHRHLYILGSFEKELPKVFDENNVKEHGNTFREMALDVYNPDNTKFEHES